MEMSGRPGHRSHGCLWADPQVSWSAVGPDVLSLRLFNCANISWHSKRHIAMTSYSVLCMRTWLVGTIHSSMPDQIHVLRILHA